MERPVLLEELPPAIAGANELPSMPGVVVEILRLARSEDAGIPEFAEVISGDPALAAKLLQLANSSVFSVGQEVATLERACMVIGLKTVQMMSLSFSLRTALPGPGAAGAFDLKEYWRRSLIAAVAGRAFSRTLQRGFDDEAFLCGLLSHLGQLVMALCMPAEYGKVIAASGGHWPTRELEHAEFGFDRSGVGGTLLQSWGLPEAIYEAVAYATCSERLPDERPAGRQQLACTVGAAELIVSILRDGASGEPLVRLQELASREGLAREQLDAMLDGLEGEIAESADLLDVELDGTRSHTEILEEARTQLMKISLGAVAEMQHAKRRADALQDENRHLAEEATIDKLTGIANRARFDEIIALEIEALRSSGNEGRLGLLMLDIDHFKQVNDNHGHQAGDAVLRRMGALLRDIAPSGSVPARYGGEEFALVVPGADASKLEEVAEHLRQRIEADEAVHDGKTHRFTVSIGGACVAGDSELPVTNLIVTKLIDAADARLYEAKQTARNCCVIAPGVLHDG